MRWWLSFVLLVFSCSTLAEEGAGGGAVQYVNLDPAFVANFGDVGRLKYVKAEISVRVHGESAATQVKHHIASIRNGLVFLLSRQEETAMTTMEGKEGLRKEALQIVKDVLTEETGEAMVEDLLFTSFVVQR